MKSVFWLLLMCPLISCDQDAKTLELTGDLYFSVFRVGAYYNKPDEFIERFEVWFDTASFDMNNQNDQWMFSYYQILTKHNLLNEPSVDLVVQKDSVVRLYLDKEDYDRIKIHKRRLLQEQNKKVVIISEVRVIEDGLYRCIDLTSVQVIDGQTFQLQKKLKVEDYD